MECVDTAAAAAAAASAAPVILYDVSHPLGRGKLQPAPTPAPVGRRGGVDECTYYIDCWAGAASLLITSYKCTQRDTYLQIMPQMSFGKVT